MTVPGAGGDFGGLDVGPLWLGLDGSLVDCELVGPDEGAFTAPGSEVDCEQAPIVASTAAITTRRRATSLFRPPDTHL